MIYQTVLVTFTRTDHSIPVSLINAFHEACKDLIKLVIMCEIKKKQYRVLPMFSTIGKPISGPPGNIYKRRPLKASL